MNKTILIAAVLVITGLSETARADSWRCGRQIVKTGDSQAAVIQRCGRPDFSTRSRETVKQRGGRKSRSVGTRIWTYNTGRRGSKSLVFADGRLLRIEHSR